jgi:hypothetical protein
LGSRYDTVSPVTVSQAASISAATGVKALDHLGVGVLAAVEPIEVLRQAGFVEREIVELEAELRRQGANPLVAGVDELAAELADLPLGKRAGERPHPPADPVLRLVDSRRDASLREPPGAGQTGDAAADDGDLAARSAEFARQQRAHAPAAQRQTSACDRRAGDELTPGRTGAPAEELQRLARRHLATAGKSSHGEELLELRKQDGLGHGGLRLVGLRKAVPRNAQPA